MARKGRTNILDEAPSVDEVLEAARRLVAVASTYDQAAKKRFAGIRPESLQASTDAVRALERLAQEEHTVSREKWGIRATTKGLAALYRRVREELERCTLDLIETRRGARAKLFFELVRIKRFARIAGPHPAAQCK